MTVPLYYDDPIAREFEARVRAHDPDRGTIILDQSLFYPEGGGQPGDRGVIRAGDLRLAVVDTRKGRNGDIEHIIDPSDPPHAPLADGTRVTGTLDWDHRFEYMQQHTGQHLASAALWQVARAQTVSVHQGTGVTTIEVESESLDESRMRDVEGWIDERIAADLTVRAFEVDDSQLSRFTLRRPTSRTGRVRLVEIDRTDLVACGGVHLPRTGLVSLVVAAGSERIRSRVRLSFWIGHRALAAVRSARDALKSTADLFSAHPLETPDRAARLVDDLKTANGELRRRAERIARILFDELCVDNTRTGFILEDESEDVFDALVGLVAAERATPACLVNLTAGGTRWGMALPALSGDAISRLRRDVLAPADAKGGGTVPLWRGVLPERSGRVSAREQATRFVESFARFVNG